MRQGKGEKPYRDIKELELLLAGNLEKPCRTSLKTLPQEGSPQAKSKYNLEG